MWQMRWSNPYYCLNIWLTSGLWGSMRSSLDWRGTWPRTEEMVNYFHRKMKEEAGRRIAAVDAFHIAEKVTKSSRASCWRRRGKGKVLQLPWTVLRGKQKANGCFFAMLRTSWPPLKSRSFPWRKSWRRSKRPNIKQRRLERRQSCKGMISEWLRSRKPLGSRSRGYIGTTASKYGMKLSTKLGLRLHLYLGRQRVSTTPPAICVSSSNSSKANTPPKIADPEKSSPNGVPPSSGSPPKVAK